MSNVRETWLIKEMLSNNRFFHLHPFRRLHFLAPPTHDDKPIIALSGRIEQRHFITRFFPQDGANKFHRVIREWLHHHSQVSSYSRRVTTKGNGQEALLLSKAS